LSTYVASSGNAILSGTLGGRGQGRGGCPVNLSLFAAGSWIGEAIDAGSRLRSCLPFPTIVVSTRVGRRHLVADGPMQGALVQGVHDSSVTPRLSTNDEDLGVSRFAFADERPTLRLAGARPVSSTTRTELSWQHVGPASKLSLPPGCSMPARVSRAMVTLGGPDRAQLVVFAFESGVVWPSRIDEGRLAYRGCRTRRGELRPARQARSRPRGDDGESGAGNDRGVFTALLAQPWEHGGGVDAGSVPLVGGRRDRGQGPQLATSQLDDGFGRADTRADLLLQIGDDERMQRLEGLRRTAVAAPRPLHHDLRIAVATRAASARRWLGRDVAGARAGRAPRRA
jgi:hypothetical protein